MKLMSIDYLKKAMKSRTILLGCLISVLSFIQGIVYEFPVPVLYQGLIGSVLGVLVILLRMDTTDAIDDKE
jgi:hypothetical protein